MRYPHVGRALPSSKRQFLRQVQTWFWLLALSSSCAVLNAQFTSSIEGTVMDQSGAVMPGARLTLTNTATGITTPSVTSEGGFYRFPSLPASSFTLSIAAPGFKTTTLSDMRLEIGERRTTNVTLEIGSESVAVSITADAATVELSEARVSGVIATKQVTDLPILGRNFLNLVGLTPGVTGTPTGLGSSSAQAGADVFNPDPGVSLNAAGNRSEQNGFAVDSGTTTSMVRHGVVNLQPNAESVQEVRIAVNNFSAEQGSDAGASVNVLTKQGTNTLHGSLAYWHSNNVLQSRNVFQQRVPEFRRNEVAGSIGGPIIRNRTFIFGSIDVLRAAETPGSTVTVETPEFINVVRQRYPNNKSAFLLQNFPTSVTPARNFRTAGAIQGVNCAGLASPSTSISTPIGDVPCNLPITGDGVNEFSTPRAGDQWNVRVDHMLTDRDRLYGNVYRNVLKTTGVQTRPEFEWEFPRWNWYFNLNETHTFSPSLVNEFGANLTRIHGEIYCAHCEIPQIGITGLSGFGVGGPTPFIQNNFFYRDVISWVKGKHTIKGGAQFSALQSNWKPTASYQRPSFNFNNVWDFALDNPFSESNIGFNPLDGSVYTPDVGERQKVLAFFLEDSWRVKPNLMVQFGLRWETFGKVGQSTLGNNVEWRSGSDFFSRIADGKNVTSQNILDNADLNNFAPRLSFAYDPTKTGRLSIRGGVGIFYDIIPSQLYGGAHYTPPIYMLLTASSQTAPLLPLYAFGQSATEPYLFPRPSGLGVIALDERNGSSFARSAIVWVDPNLRNSYTTSYFFGVQYALTSTMTLEANYNGNQGRKIYSKYNVNRFNGDLLQNNGVLRRLNPSFGTIDYGHSNLTSRYNGGNISVRQRMNRGLMFQAAYTFGRAIDYASSFGGNLPIVDVTNLELNRGVADHNVAHRLTFSSVWQLPTLESSSRLMKGALGGWQVSTVVTLQTGRPFTVFCSQPFGPVRNAGAIVGNSGCDYNADGHNYDRPHAPASSVTTDGLSRSDYLNGVFVRSDFPVPGLGQVGDLGRNTYQGPGYANTDLALMKSFRLPVASDGMNVQFRAEAFNVFNRVNLGQPDGSLASATFGRSTSAFAGRGFQFGFRMEF